MPGAANPKAWTKLADGPKNLLIKVHRWQPLVQIHVAATGSAPTDESQYLPLEWDDVSLSVSLPSTDSLWYRVTTGHTSTMSVISQDA